MNQASPAAGASAAEVGRERLRTGLHLAWRVSIVITISTGLFHLLNLVAATRMELGPMMATPFRVAFTLSWLLLLADLAASRRSPKIDYADALVAALVAAFLLRGVLVADTFGIALNWLITGAGMFYLVKHGMRDSRDVCLVLLSVVAAVLALCLFGLAEYIAKANPLFDSIQVEAIGSDVRIAASDQFYRVRSLVGHPGFTGAVLLIAIPLVVFVLWRRRILLTLALSLIAVVIFLTFSRGSWLLAALVLLPLMFFKGRHWFKRHLKWVLPPVALLAAFFIFDYWIREEASVSLDGVPRGAGLYLLENTDGPYAAVDGEGVRPERGLLHFAVDNQSLEGGGSPVTVVIYYFDNGLGDISVEYSAGGEGEAALKQTAAIAKTNTQQWTSAAFYIEDPVFQARQDGTDFRLVDEESLVTVSKVSVQKGKLKLPSLVEQQWISRRGSFATRLEFFPFTWDVLKHNPLGVGLFNTPGSKGHAIDSLPLTWMIEFGWPGLLLIAGMAWLVVTEGIKVYRSERGAVTALYLALMLVLLHGVHLMILYDKPSLVLTATIGAVYASIRPWRSGGAAIDISREGCMI